MKYINKEGKLIQEDSAQDRLLRWLYTHSLGRGLLRLLVKSGVSKAGGWLLERKCSRIGIRPFVKSHGIDLGLYEKQKFDSYNDFFTRQVRREHRPIAEGETTLVSPCDGRLTVYPVREDSCFCIKNTWYTLPELLRSEKLAGKYRGGCACVFRLTVDDYHRYCYVDDGIKSTNRRIPGVFHTVNPAANDVYPIYKENTREYSLLKSRHFKTVLMMEVGALMVGRITNYDQACNVKRGQEKGRFEFGGSTIILLFQKDAVVLDPRFIKNTENECETLVRMGEAIGFQNEKENVI